MADKSNMETLFDLYNEWSKANQSEAEPVIQQALHRIGKALPIIKKANLEPMDLEILLSMYLVIMADNDRDEILRSLGQVTMTVMDITRLLSDLLSEKKLH